MLQKGEPVATVPLEFAGVTSVFEGDVAVGSLGLEPGFFDLVLVAERADEGNTGTDRMTVMFRR